MTQTNILFIGMDVHKESIVISLADDDRSEVIRYSPNGIWVSLLLLQEMREATNKLWVLESNFFKENIQKQLSRRVTALPRGGIISRKSF